MTCSEWKCFWEYSNCILLYRDPAVKIESSMALNLETSKVEDVMFMTSFSKWGEFFNKSHRAGFGFLSAWCLVPLLSNQTMYVADVLACNRITPTKKVLMNSDSYVQSILQQQESAVNHQFEYISEDGEVKRVLYFSVNLNYDHKYSWGSEC